MTAYLRRLAAFNFRTHYRREPYWRERFSAWTEVRPPQIYGAHS